ncbi:MAG: MFS transporter [Syntrophus sp. (in: bacteria)]|nr:MFS transporter [Syntrophus sp. (in: bacteria)]
MKKHYAWIVAFTGTLVVVLSHGFGRMSYSVILPSMRDGLGLNYTQLGLIGTGNFIGYLCLAVIGGFLAARFGARKVIFGSLILMGISLILTGLSNSFFSAFFMRLITGMGNGGSYVPMMAVPAAWFVAQKRGFATGIVAGGIGIGLSISGLVLPHLMAGSGPDGWRHAWFLLGTLVLIFSFVCYIFLRNSPAEKGLNMYGGTEPEKTGPKVTLFSAWKNVVAEKEIWKLGCVYFMYGFSYIIYLTFFVAYLTKEMGLSPARAGGIFAVLGLFSIFCGIVWGGISDVLGRRWGSMLAYITLGASYLIFAFWKGDVGIYLSAIIFGITAFSIPAILAAAAGDAVGGKLAPAGLGFITLFFGVGQAFGPAIAGWIKDTTGTFTYAFMLSAGVSFLGAIGSLVLKRKEN